MAATSRIAPPSAAGASRRRDVGVTRRRDRIRPGPLGVAPVGFDRARVERLGDGAVGFDRARRAAR